MIYRAGAVSLSPDPSFAAAAQAVLAALGIAPTPTNTALLVAWEWCEKPHYLGGAWQWNNSLNTTLPVVGSFAVNGAGVQAYPSRQTGAQAVAATLRNGFYPHLLGGIQASDAATFFSAPGEMATWGTDYACVQAAYAALGGQVGGGGLLTSVPVAVGIGGVLVGLALLFAGVEEERAV